MYYPYVHGRAAELDAVAAESSHFGKPQLIVPVVEPVLKPDGSLTHHTGKLTRTLATLAGHQATAYLVVNPHQGGFLDPAIQGSWTAAMSGPLGDPAQVRPTFKIRSTTTTADLAAFVSLYSGRMLGLVIADERALNAAAIAAALSGTNVKVFLLPGIDSVDYVSHFSAAHVVRVAANFQALSRNADYQGSELYSNNHLGYPSTSSPGFADYTVLGPQVALGGGRVGAVVIHLTYLDRPTGNIWVEHFVSDETDVTQGSFASKFLEAVDHLAAKHASHPGRFVASDALQNYLGQHANGNATSPGKNKQQMIQHHLFLVARLLGIV